MNRIQEKLFELQSFKKQYDQLVLDSVHNTFPKIQRLNLDHEDEIIDWNNLLSIASFLQKSSDREHLDAALRIAQQCICSKNTTDMQKSGALVVLESLTNKRAISLAKKRELINKNHFNNIPLPLSIEIIRRNFEFSILNELEDKPIFLNRFQKDVYQSYKESSYLSISAPTSAGKSFILERIIQEVILKEDRVTLVYLVPTRALIGQVEDEFRQMLKEGNIKNINISSVPQIDNEDLIKTNLFIFTQERLHWFRSENPNKKISLLIVDEAQKIQDGTRGILLQQKIEDIRRDFPDVKIYFSSPFTDNPEELLQILPDAGTGKTIKTEFVAVNQNLLFVSQVPSKPTQWKIELCLKDKVKELGEISLKARPIPVSKKFPLIINELASSNGGNIVYANGAAEAEKISSQLKDILGDEYSNISEDVSELISVVKKSIHPKYVLADVLEKKIAFHYGNMPLLIRQEIERLFAKGDIHFIICTSTLLEGVNLPAKNIFIHNPKRGKNSPLNITDFWNLAGRAGRLGKEFEGNIICVSPESWKIKPTYNRTRQRIKKAIDAVSEDGQKLLDFVNNDSPRNEAMKNPQLEYAFTYYYSKYLLGTLEAKGSFEQALLTKFDEIHSSVTIPDSILLKNPGVSPIAQMELFNYFTSKQDKIQEVIPVLPESENAAEDCYIRLVVNIHKYLSGDSLGRQFYLAILVVNWMKGYRLSSLIESNYRYWNSERSTSKKSLPVVIRDTMKDVEEYARFKFAKYSGCYIDVLRYYLRATNQTELLNEIPDLSMWLEFGVSQKTQISLIGIGLSRNTAITISEFIGSDVMTKQDVILWLRGNDIEKLDVSELMIREIKNVLATLS